jgi:hypothetical protein
MLYTDYLVKKYLVLRLVRLGDKMILNGDNLPVEK